MLRLSRNLQQLSDITKDIPLEAEVGTEQELFHEASLRQDTYYTVVPKGHNLQSGVLPEDQFFSNDKVIFWKTAYSLFEFSPSQWDYVQFALPSSIRWSSELSRVVGDCYSLPAINNGWQLLPLHHMPTYVQ